MSDGSMIEWLARPDTKPASWNPIRGCSRVSEGCRNCYAERIASRFSDPPTFANLEFVSKRDGIAGGGWSSSGVGPFWGFAKRTKDGPRWTGRVELIPEQLAEPLHWRSPRTVFVNSMSDLFHEALPDEAIDRVMAVILLGQGDWGWYPRGRHTAAESDKLNSRHEFLVLTKRAQRMHTYMAKRAASWREVLWPLVEGIVHLECFGDIAAAWSWPPPNLWLGVSVEDQATANVRIPELLSTPAVIRFVSYEPALGPVDFAPYLADHEWKHGTPGGVNWVIVGGESGPGARGFDVAWAHSTIAQCKAAGVACFVKQLGARPFAVEGSDAAKNWGFCSGFMDDCGGVHLKDKKGGDPSEWPEDLRVREWPRARYAGAS